MTIKYDKRYETRQGFAGWWRIFDNEKGSEIASTHDQGNAHFIVNGLNAIHAIMSTVEALP